METFLVEVETEDKKLSMIYDDYGNAAECALVYREQGFAVQIKAL